MNKYTFYFADGKDSAFGETQDEAWKSLGYDHSMIGNLKKVESSPIIDMDLSLTAFM